MDKTRVVCKVILVQYSPRTHTILEHIWDRCVPVQTRSLGYLSTTDNLHESWKVVVVLHGIAKEGN